jgi:hypothetical protein
VSDKPLLKRWWVRISLAFLVLGLVAYVARNFVVRKGLETAVTEVTGFPLEIDSFNLGIAQSKVVVKGMHLRNPRGFPDPRCITIRRLVADVDLGSAFKDEFHAEAIDLDIDEIIVVKNAVGETNLDRLAALGGGGDEKEPAPEAKGKKEPAKERKWRCDRFHLRIPRVVFLDYTSLRQGKPKEEVYVLNVDETFHDLTEPDAIIRIIVLKVLAGTPIRLVNATVDTLAAGVSGVVGGVVKGVGGVVEGVGGLIGVGGKEEPKKEPPPPPPKKPVKKK